MTASEQPGNLYAHELVQILAAHGLDLTALVERVGLDPALVERLRQSLTDPYLSPVLNPQEQEALVTTLLLTATEQRRLLAALLATAIQHQLQGQIGLANAHRVTAQAYPFLLNATSQADLDTLGVSERAPDHGAREDQTWQAIWEAIEAASLAFQMSQGRALSRVERMYYLREARMWLEQAQADLAGLSSASKASPVWHTCHSKANKDLKVVLRSLRHFEARP